MEAAQPQEAVTSLHPSSRRRKLTRRAIERMCIPERYRRVSYPEVRSHREVIGRYFKGIVSALEEGYGFVLWGDNGTGKTGAAVVCLKEARRRSFTGLFITAAQFVADSVSRARFDDTFSVNQRCRNVDLLVLDDVGKESILYSQNKDGGEALIEDIIRYRVGRKLSTILTTNLSPEDVKKRYGQTFVLGLHEACVNVHMQGECMRSTGKEKMFGFFNGDNGDDDGSMRV